MNRTFTLQVTENELEQLIFSVFLNKRELEDSLSLSEKVKDYDEDSKKRYLELRQEVDIARGLFITLNNMKYGSKCGDKS